MTDPPVVACRALTKSYGAGDAGVMALRGVDLDVGPGEMVMLMGPSGCGKTTLLSIIATLLVADGGVCHVFGTEISSLAAAQLAAFRARHLGFVFQSFNLLPALTVAENVGIPLRLNGVRGNAATLLIDAALDAVGLRERGRSLPRQLSGGQQQRVAIARALVHKPRLLLCDEPTSALDHDTGQAVMTLLRAATASAGAAAVIVTHDERIRRFADRVVHMEDGRVAGDALAVSP